MPPPPSSLSSSKNEKAKSNRDIGKNKKRTLNCNPPKVGSNEIQIDQTDHNAIKARKQTNRLLDLRIARIRTSGNIRKEKGKIKLGLN